jgi:deazaflavin-dependent oxidoreductase (nitroreductase family)
VARVVNLKDELAKAFTTWHEAVFRASRGRLLGKAGGMPVLVLTTTGRRSGKKRTTMLTAPVVEDDRIVLVASYGGDSRHPTWFLNLREHPDVEVLMEGASRRMRARVASAEEKEQLWPPIVAAYRGYAAYQGRTERDIPVVILEP